MTVSADSLIGEAGQGWSIIMAGLDFERFGIGGNVILLELLIDDLVTVARHGLIDGVAALAARGHPCSRSPNWPSRSRWRRHSSTTTSNVSCTGAEQPGDGSIAKLSFAETYHRVSAYGAELARWSVPWPSDPSVERPNSV